MLTIEVWADFVCPFSYISLRNLSKAIESENIKQVEIRFNSFILYPFAKQGKSEPMQQYLSNKYGISEGEAWMLMEDVAKIAKESDLHFKLQKLCPTNTFTAHRLAKLAKRYRLYVKLYEICQRAFFEQQQTLDNTEMLQQLALAAGLPQKEVKEVLSNSARLEAEVEADLYHAQQLLIKGTPYFIFNEVKHVVGLQSFESFVRILKGL
ncbi:MAG: DsbA family oxidoreductase [Lysinibacillus sp.]